MYRIAEAKGVENLIAGAWGCGVFMQDPSTVATLLINAARNYNIPNIYFAIPNRNSRNFRIFLEVLEKNYWLIYDACRTELEREGPEGTLDAEEIDKIGKKN